MAINKVNYGDQTLMDLTEDTVTEDKVLEGETFHDRSGNSRVGSLVIPVQDVEVNGESVVDENGVAEVVVPVSGDVSTTDFFESYTGGKIKSLQMELSPIQDLHGYDHPWVGGASKQLYNHNQTNNNNISVTLNSEGSLDAVGTPSVSVGSIRLCNPTLMLKAGTYKATLISGNNLPSGVQLAVSSVIGGSWTRLGIGGIGETFTFTLNDDNTPIGVTLATTVTAGTAVNITNIKLLITADDVTDRTWCSYTNICPISGHTQAKLEQRGKNLFNPSNAINGYIDGSGGVYKIVAEENARTIYARCEPNTTYTISKTAGKRFVVGWSDTLPDIGVTVNDQVFYTTASAVTFTTGTTAKYIIAYVWLGTQDTITADEMLASCQIELGLSATDYEPYQGKDYIINLGGTYYWLRGDVVSGKWYVIGRDADLGTFTWTREQWGAGWDFYTLVNGIKRTSDYDDVTSSLCEQYKPVSRNTMYDTNEDSIMAVMSINNALKIRDTRYSDSDTFKTAMSGVKIVYELATPIPLDLTPQQILAIIGENHLSAPLDQQEIIEIIARNIAEFNEVIDDENVSEDFTYSSEKIEDRLDEYVDKDAVEEKSATTEFETINGGILDSLKVSLTPNQDLHGYDSPWVGGSRKNLLPNNLTTETVYDVTYETQEDGSIEGNGTSTGWANANLVNDLLLKAGTYILSGTTITGAYISVITLLGGEDYSITGPNSTRQITFETDTHVMVRISAKPATVLSNAKYYPMIRLATESDPTFEPYSNICPITGHTQVDVRDDGKNYFDISTCIQNKYIDDDGIINNDNAFMYSLPMVVEPNEYYTFSGIYASTGGANYRLLGYDKNDNFVSLLGKQGASASSPNISISSQIPNNVKFVRVSLSKQSSNCQLEKGNQATPYVPYNGYQVTVNLGGTYYSGTLDVVTGVFTPDTASDVFDGSENWTIYPSDTSAFFFVTVSSMTSTSWSYVLSEVFKDVYKETDARNNDCSIWSRYQQIHIHAPSSIVPSGVSNEGLAEFKAWLSNNPQKVVYKLATPTPIQLSPTMVKALVGENHLSAPLDGQEITESKYRELFTWDEVEEIAQKIADSKIDNIYTSYNTTFSSAFTEARYVKKIYGAPVLTAGLQIVLSGATSITFNHQLIFSDSQTCCELIQFGSGPRIGITDVAISQGSVTFTFDSPLTKAIGFRCRITNDFVS